MTTTTLPTSTAPPAARITYRSVLVLAALVVLPGVAYVFGVLLPYSSRGTGADGAGWLGLLGYYSMLLLPLGALVSLGGCTLQLLAVFPRSQRRVSPAVGAGLGTVAVACVVVLVFLLSPSGRAVTTWMQD